MKLKKSILPDGHNFENFICYGPRATKDGEFNNTKMADFGCFTQEGKNCNKYYHACVCKSRLNSKWYTYFQWGRVGNNSFDFQFQEFESEEEAIKKYKKQCASKNNRRGEWYNHPSLGKILRAKPGKDCYLVRNIASKNSALPSIKKKSVKINNLYDFDAETENLLKDLKAGTISYAKNSMSNGVIPDIQSIKEARHILSILSKTKKDSELEELTRILYSKIPKTVSVKEKVTLSQDNIRRWYEDLEAFESAFNSLEKLDLNITYFLKHIDKSNQLRYIIERLVENSTNNKHAYLRGSIKVLNVWEITNIPDSFIKKQEEVAKEFNGKYYPLIFQPERTQLEHSCNCQLLFHGSRSVNIGKIITSGFKLPKELTGVQINGWANGPGCYHASDYKKSIGYCSVPNSYWSRGSGAVNNRKAFMFLNDVILGNSHIISYPKNYHDAPKGFHSVIADTRGSFQNEEFMVYDSSMLYPRYLIEFDI